MWTKTASYLQDLVNKKLIPGTVLRVERKGQLLYEGAFGYRHTAPSLPMQKDTLFDLASLTKVIGTLGCLMTLFELSRVRLADTLGTFLPAPADKAQITLLQLLTHTAGFPASFRLQKAVEEIYEVPLVAEPGRQVLYTDLGFLLVGRVIEQVTGKRLDQAVAACTKQWGMQETIFNPKEKERCAATEWRDALGRHQWGEVHDENATVLGGIAGHAGLFSTAQEVAMYGNLYLSAEPTSWFARATKSYTEGLNERRGLGWKLYEPGCFAGPLAGEDSFGHTGFTGTSVWVDPAYDLVIVLLTNRVHYGRQLQMNPIRKEVHTRIYEAIRR